MPIISVDVPQETVSDAEFIQKACGFKNKSEAYRNMLYRGRQTIIADLSSENEAVKLCEEAVKKRSAQTHTKAIRRRKATA